MLAYKMVRVAMLMFVAISTSLLLVIEPTAGGIIRSSLIGVSTSLLIIAMAGVGMAMDLRQSIAVGRRFLPITGLIWLMQLVLLLFLTVLLVRGGG